MQTPQYSPIHPLPSSRDIASFELETDDLLPDDIYALEDVVGIPMQDFRIAASHVIGEVSDFIDTVISGVSRFSHTIVSSVSRETYQPLEVEDDFEFFMDSSLNQPMTALESIYGHVSEIHGLMGFGVMGQVGSVFLNTFDRILASDMYTRLGRAIRGHDDSLMSVRDMYVLLSSSDIVSDEGDSGSDFFTQCKRKLVLFFSKKKDINLKKNRFPSIKNNKKNDALPFYVKDKKDKNFDGYYTSKPLCYSYISISDSVQFIQINRLFKDFYINRNTFQHRVNEFLQNIIILIGTYTMFIRQANLNSDNFEDKDLQASLERLCLSADTLKSIGNDKNILGILGVETIPDKQNLSLDNAVFFVKESLLNCKSIALDILSQKEIWDLLPMTNDNVVILEAGKKDVLETVEKINEISDHIDVLSDMSSVLDVQRVSASLKQFRYKLKLSGL